MVPRTHQSVLRAGGCDRQRGRHRLAAIGQVFKNFEFQAEYRVLKKGSDSGILSAFHSRESMPREPHWPARCYQLQIIDAEGGCMLLRPWTGTAPVRAEDRRPEVGIEGRQAVAEDSPQSRSAHRAKGAALNDVVVTTSEAIQVAEGYIGLQGENGHFEWRDLKIREFK